MELFHSAWNADAGDLIARLEAAGYETWAVGGCVRDMLLHKQPTDWDLTTAADPQTIAEICSDCTVLSVGEKHGTMTVEYRGRWYEITMFRTETGGDGRHPSCVQHAPDLRSDLARRDYTINALAYHPQRGLRDEFCGLADLAARRLRTVGDAPRRFAEDYLRILRGLRFAACLGFSIEEDTAAAMRSCFAGMQRLSGERIWQELCRLLCANACAAVLRQFSAVLCGIGGGWEDFACSETTLEKLPQLPCDALIRLMALLREHPQREAALLRLRLSRAQMQRIHGLWQSADALCKVKEERDSVEESQFPSRDDKATLQDVGAPLQDAKASSQDADSSCEAKEERDSIAENSLPSRGAKVSLRDALSSRKAKEERGHVLPWLASLPDGTRWEDARMLLCLLDRQELWDVCEKIAQEDLPFSVRELRISGDDLLKLGVSRGEAVGKMLRTLLDAVWRGEAGNETSELIVRAKREQ